MSNTLIEIIKGLIEQGSVSDSFLTSLYNKYIVSPVYIPLVMMRNIAKVIRTRTNNKIEGIYYNVSQISYPPPEKARNDRANLAGDSMFYGVLIDSSTDVEAVGTSLLESNPGVFGVETEGCGIVTMGTWNVLDNFLLYSLPVKKEMSEKHSLAQMISDIWCSNKNRFSDNDISFMEYMGELMSESGNNIIYKVTANFVKYCLLTHPELKGIVYPSVQSQGEGMCAAIIPDAVNSNMRCIKSQMLYYSKTERIKASVETVATSSVLDDGTFNWNYKEGWSEEKVRGIINSNN